uniref:Multidrug resistance-associated protein 4-like n=1 Tax=Saccoglossus kowalevskii TaxID=10224 RepID=A0ABM0MLN3_SACKO|nr:PREDICTED: multidrug resistance-associated protein 4-like [Saccoglossus kowalevskii]
MTTKEAYLWATAISLSLGVRILIYQMSKFRLARIGMQLKIACCSLIYRKVLRLSNTALGGTSTGHIVNLLSNDVNKFEVVFYYIHYLWISPLVFIFVMVVLWRLSGPVCLVAFSFLALAMFGQVFTGKYFSRLRAKTATLTDERVEKMSDIVSAMRTIKMFAWEETFSKLIRNIRRKEIQVIQETSKLLALMHGNPQCFIPVFMFLLFVISSLVGENSVDIKTVFLVMPLVLSIRLPMTYYYPQAITRLSQSYITVQRIQNLLLMDETASLCYWNHSHRCKRGMTVKSITCTWDKSVDIPTLKDISFNVRPGELLAVVGPVGSGKSSLLMALLNELQISNGGLEVMGSVAYASQQPWIFSASLRQNIIFGRRYDKKKYDKVIDLCDLERDIRTLSYGDRTLVGERGVALSGGQRSRVSLARVLYSDADVYLLDDPLSAVDASVGRHIFNKCIKEYLSSKLCILVTHQLQYLCGADRILILEQGKTSTICTFDEMVMAGVDFNNSLEKEKNAKQHVYQGHNIFNMGNVTTYPSRRRISLAHESPMDSMSWLSLSEMPGFLPEFPAYTLEIVQRFPICFPQSGKKDNMECTAIQEFEVEERHSGSIDWKIYIDYFKAGGIWLFIFSILITIFAQVVIIMTDWWLSFWAQTEERYHDLEIIAFNSSSINMNNTWFHPGLSTHEHIYIYSVLVVSLYTFAILRTYLLFKVCLNASKNLHNRMFEAIIRAPILFYDTNPVGRILNRFSRDIGYMDEVLPKLIFDFIQPNFAVCGSIILACVINPWVLIPAIPMVPLVMYIRSYYLQTSRDIKRFEGTTRSPVFSHLSATLQGLCTIRAFNAEDIFVREFDDHQNLHTGAYFLHITMRAWLSLRLEIICACFISSVAFTAIAVAEGLNVILIGLSMTYSMSLMTDFQTVIGFSTEVENQMTSSERVISYCNICPEGPLQILNITDPGWPKDGNITMTDVSFKYSKNSPAVIKNICFSIRAMEKVGIVGRTGAGKSSLINCIFRMAEPSGTIKIDGVDITRLGLHDLRSKISIITQEPVLFRGSLRSNLDPFTEYADSEILKALEQVQLLYEVQRFVGGLDTELAESGSNLSVGQRQLVSLARTLLRKNKILILDEATANIDKRTDAIIQETIRNRFQHCTVLTIAHRLNTVMDSDRILVMSNGRVAEFDEPHLLLQNPLGELSRMVAQTGRSEAKDLHDIAMAAYNKRHLEAKMSMFDGDQPSPNIIGAITNVPLLDTLV